MLFCRQVNFFISSSWISAFTWIILLATSCTEPRRYQKDKPFVYKSEISLYSDLPASQKIQLRQNLANQMDDSVKVRTVLAIHWKPPFFYYRLSKPPVFDTLHVERSKTFMNALLNSKGYFNPVITDTFTIDSVKDQKRVNVRFFVTPGKALRLDSIGYSFTTPELQQLAMASRNKSLLKKNEPYSIQNISGELDRLLNIYRNNGFYKINKEDLYAEQDTVVAALINPGLDVFEQIELLDSLQKKLSNPTINVVFMQRKPKDISHLAKYYLGNVKVFPDRMLLQQGDQPEVSDTSLVDGYTFYTTSNRFKKPFVARNILLRKGNLYQQNDYYNTINKFTDLGAWRQVDINLRERSDSSRILDADLFLYPAKKQGLNIDFETSRNASDVLTTGSLFGLGLNLGLRDRNAFRESIQTSSNIRLGVELGKNIVQTVQASFSHKIFVPRFISPFKTRSEKFDIRPRTIIDFNTAYTSRKPLFDVRSVNTSLGYEWSRKNHGWLYLPLNFEYTDVSKTDSFLKLEKKFPTLAQAFNNGLIISQMLTYNTGSAHGNAINFFKARIEESGGMIGLFKNLEKGDLRRFLKLDLEYKHFINFQKSAWAFRAFGGYGYVYGKTGTQKENNLPFFKAYFGGGPYSMRAWQVRQLGLGSSRAFADSLSTYIFGDVRLEGNVEFRFSLATIAGIKLKSAFFVDMGNVWGKAVDNNQNTLDSAQFKLSRLYADLAVGAGTSLRFDFDFFLIRLDWAYKVKNPIYADENNGWLHKLQIANGQFQLGIGYPF